VLLRPSADSFAVDRRQKRKYEYLILKNVNSLQRGTQKHSLSIYIFPSSLII
jgi:hypothetical protein